jgi:hypothetical protein
LLIHAQRSIKNAAGEPTFLPFGGIRLVAGLALEKEPDNCDDAARPKQPGIVCGRPEKSGHTGDCPDTAL